MIHKSDTAKRRRGKERREGDTKQGTWPEMI